jgi:hypothetical protein
MAFYRYAAGATALLAAVSSAGCVNGPSFDEYRELLGERAGPAFQDCGLVRLGQARSEAVACSQQALVRKAPFVVVFQVQGIDSELFHGLAVNGEGTAAWLQWDSDARGSGSRFLAKRWVQEKSCSAPSVTDARIPIKCATS